ncbi:MAG TPA: HlyD family efflux transporter periplasmic adaptor subunit, partial [Chthoniobacterales bacterium]|nr:HlyD family efflux transporter periplasmic adaptor subunit [Chthoniobacterales bacterium]
MQRSFEVIAGTQPARAPGFTPVISSMDVPRPDVARKKKKRRLMIAGASLLGIILITFVVARLKPAAISVDRAAVWVDTVKRGPMLRQVRGLGTLVPEDIRWIAASKEGRVEKIIVRPGAKVQPDTVILELSSADLEQLALDAESQAKTAEAELTTLRATLQRELLNQESTTAQVRSEYQQSKMEAETNENLKKNGLIADLAYKTSIIKRDELQNRDAIEQKRLEFARDSIEPQIVAKQATVDQLEASAKLKARDVEALHVKAGMTGVLQQLPVEVGQRVIAGTNLARVADPTKLKAQIKIAETQAKDIQINQPASIDTRNGIVAGHVTRVDPAVEQGTVTVDVALDGPLPKGARPDLSVDGTIELERLDNVLYVGRPAFAQ